MQESLTFDDVLLEPQYSAVLPRDVSTATQLTADLPLALPLLSAAMDSVTESAMAIALAQSGGLGVIHKNMTPEKQATEVEKVKRYESGIVTKPVTIAPTMTVGEARNIQRTRGFSGLPVVNDMGMAQGIITNRDLRFETKLRRPVRELMTPLEQLVTVRPGFKMEAAKALMHKHRIERVVIVDSKGILHGLVTVKDIIRSEIFPHASKDSKGRLRTAAAVGADDVLRIGMLADAGADVLVVDSAHGHSKGVLDCVAKIKKMHLRGVLLIAGNVATGAGAKSLAEAGADAIKVGIGPGSICTTRMVAGVGMPQISAIQAAANACARRKTAIIADGGLRYSGDIAKAIAAGADAVMVGGLLAGATESPGETELYQGRVYKRYRGMGSLAAMRKGSGERYFQQDNDAAKLVPEGVEGRVPYKGAAADILHQLIGGLRAAMGYVGAPTIGDLKKRPFVRVSFAGLRESHVHDVQITREAPNYQVEN
ncbi:IMP dehydrogenase [Candidatus Persebacteraceae bacterium Df01]|jgi:IMP dehydrogenase|uniref:Inosine-5'-monophosphate dehydrogenase n=1 Tax=Candidatus Doriopsillibacter californiensis TaxID=2970740 RepID=A0ABT7QLA3_9GAMM|nr:IMP dehydrogenase [Candidatus Persebacteraceae bacterium Df01]